MQKTVLATLLLAAGIMGFVSVPAYAQITTGEPSSKVIRTGNRAEAGDFGLYLGVTSTMIGNWVDGETKLSALPLINLKYMMTDQAEWRLGLELYKTSSRLNGEVTQKIENNSHILPAINKSSSSNAMFYPGFAWHFSSRNILDVYVGAELPIGWDSSTEYSETGTLEPVFDPDNITEGITGYNRIISTNKVTKRSFVIGLGAFIGLQAYIADLPLALGVELGISSRLDAGLKYKHVVTGSETGETQTWYTSALSEEESLNYSSLKARTGDITGEARVTLTYYFK
ncbi:MAG TPA: hypothetical protein IAC04_04305 [Candidatus Coprenecus stercoravium]|uniref:Outer membrane protein beta-barrel domain-containing protein n=1 Tax=Candidatus Coprenecus stercoravium TaxID=2840735 RepID=A0A9D2GR25_9BACT|nr:hypothetical protein [Candidatus Coprenecus stercoravium]